jgi:hypothetical protein
MATVIDRPPVDPLPSDDAPRPAERLTGEVEAPAVSASGVSFVQWLLAALLVGAGAVHLAMAPSHLGESTVEGIGFLVAAWLQVGLAVAVVLRPSRRVAGATIAVSAACIGAWLVSRTVGLPFGQHAGDAESVTFVDGVTVAMEAAAVFLGAALLSGRVRRFRSTGWALAGVVGVLALTSAVLASPEARNHAEGAHGHEELTTAAAATADDGHDHGAVDAAAPAENGPVSLDGHEVHGVKADDIAAESEPNQPLDAATRDQLAEQLTVAREVAMQYPTVADATAAGYGLVGGFGPGSGAHYIGGALGFGGGAFDASKPMSLIYDGTSPTSEIIGLMYYGMGESAPEGFAGPNDHWHRHSGVCTAPGAAMVEVLFPVDADVTQEQCTAAGGFYMTITGWMVHAWVVPSWESPLGVFSHDNPDVRCADGTYDTDEIGRCEGT